MATIELFFPRDHRAADGHFPGNPIIPGAVLLNEVLLTIESEVGIALSPGEIKAAKFFYPTRPGDLVLIEYTRIAEGDLKFNCAVNERTVLSGQVKCGVPSITK